jgi:glycosyltransferase involved in cell wall biosynthesis
MANSPLPAGAAQDNARVSVILAAFNAERTIARAIESALMQTKPPFEILVVDDGSTDATADAVHSLKDPSIRLIQQSNAGQSAALNRGARESEGDYIKFLDADDLLNEQHLSAQLDALRGTRNVIASCRWGYFVGEAIEPLVRNEHSYRDYDDPMEWIVDSLTLDEGMMGGWMWLIPRELLQRAGGWDERLSLNNDFDFSIRLLLASSGVRFADGAVYAYRKGVAQALSSTRHDTAMRSAFETTQAGCAALLAREDSPRIRRICADRWQWWQHHFYPEYPNLAAKSEEIIGQLGGSNVVLQGGLVMSLLLPLLGWKRTRRVQAFVHRNGWQRVLRWKHRRQLDEMNKQVVHRAP